jgi:hypothetical protein
MYSCPIQRIEFYNSIPRVAFDEVVEILSGMEIMNINGSNQHGFFEIRVGSSGQRETEKSFIWFAKWRVATSRGQGVSKGTTTE